MNMFNKQVKGARISTWQSECEDHTPYHRSRVATPTPRPTWSKKEAIS